MRLLNFIPELDRPMDQFNKLDPMLQAIYFDAANFLYCKFKKRFLITSMYRDDPSSVHGWNRGLDFDICEERMRKDKVLPAYEGGVLPMEAELTATYIEKKYRYNPANNLYVLVYGTRDPKGLHWDHGHIQSHKLTDEK